MPNSVEMKVEHLVALTAHSWGARSVLQRAHRKADSWVEHSAVHSAEHWVHHSAVLMAGMRAAHLDDWRAGHWADHSAALKVAGTERQRETQMAHQMVQMKAPMWGGSILTHKLLRTRPDNTLLRPSKSGTPAEHFHSLRRNPNSHWRHKDHKHPSTGRCTRRQTNTHHTTNCRSRQKTDS